jgi:hypothetical protein
MAGSGGLCKRAHCPTSPGDGGRLGFGALRVRFTPSRGGGARSTRTTIPYSVGHAHAGDSDRVRCSRCHGRDDAVPTLVFARGVGTWIRCSVMANACNPCPCGEMEGACDHCRAAFFATTSAALFKPVPERLVTCKHGDKKNLCLVCRSTRDTTLCIHDRVAEACRYCSREDHISAEEKPQVDPLEFSLWLQAQDTEALSAWIKQCG